MYTQRMPFKIANSYSSRFAAAAAPREKRTGTIIIMLYKTATEHKRTLTRKKKLVRAQRFIVVAVDFQMVHGTLKIEC